MTPEPSGRRGCNGKPVVPSKSGDLQILDEEEGQDAPRYRHAVGTKAMAHTEEDYLAWLSENPIPPKE